MASPTLLTEAGLAKMLGLIDSTAGTSAIRLPVSLTKGWSRVAEGDVTRPPGWMGVATHNDGDTLATPGGFTLPAGSYPILAAGGADSNSATEGNRRTAPNRLHEAGAQLVLPGGSYIQSTGAYTPPLKATGGAVALTQAGANQAFSVALASHFAYLTDLYLLRTDVLAQIPNNAEVRIMDASSGVIVFTLLWPAAGPLSTAPDPAQEFFPFHFSNPPRTSVVSGQFWATLVGANITWTIACNGYYSTGV